MVGHREAVLVPHAVEREVDDLHGLAVVDAAEVPASCVVRAYLLLGRGALLLEAQIRGRAAGVGTRAGRARTSRPERRGDRYCRAGRRGSEASPQLAKADDCPYNPRKLMIGKWLLLAEAALRWHLVAVCYW